MCVCGGGGLCVRLSEFVCVSACVFVRVCVCVYAFVCLSVRVCVCFTLHCTNKILILLKNIYNYLIIASYIVACHLLMHYMNRTPPRQIRVHILTSLASKYPCSLILFFEPYICSGLQNSQPPSFHNQLSSFGLGK